MKTSLSMGIPTGRQPFVARLRLIFFCFVLPGPGGGGSCLGGIRARPLDKEPLVGLVLLGHSLASFSLAWGWSPPDRGVRRRGLVWVDVGTLDKGQLDMGKEGGTRREGLWSP